MKVLLTNEGALSDFEVLQLLQERRESRLHKSANVAYAERNWMDHKVLKFLTQAHSKCAQLTASQIQAFLQQVDHESLALTPSETLQFINHIPMELVDVHLIVEDCAGRFTDAQVEQLIRVVKSTLGSSLAQEEDADASQEDDDQAAVVKTEDE